jgi:hypothetical protein
MRKGNVGRGTSKQEILTEDRSWSSRLSSRFVDKGRDGRGDDANLNHDFGKDQSKGTSRDWQGRDRELLDRQATSTHHLHQESADDVCLGSHKAWTNRLNRINPRPLGGVDYCSLLALDQIRGGRNKFVHRWDELIDPLVLLQVGVNGRARINKILLPTKVSKDGQEGEEVVCERPMS